MLLSLLVLAAAWPCAAPARATVVYSQGVGPTVVAAQDTGLQPVRLGTGRQPVVSPDGRLVAFGTDRGLVLTPADGSAPPTTVLADARASPVAFSPDGAAIVGERTSTAGHRRSTFAVPVTGGRAVTLTSRPARLVGFSGRGAVVLSERRRKGRNGSRVIVLRVADGARLRMLADRVDGAGALSATGRLAFGRRTGVAGRPDVLATRPFRRLLSGGRDDETVLGEPLGWTPSARSLVIGLVGVGNDQTDVAVLRTRTRRLRVVARGLGRLVRLSRDGRAVLAERRDPVARILSIPLDGGRATVLARDASQADWSR